MTFKSEQSGLWTRTATTEGPPVLSLWRDSRSRSKRQRRARNSFDDANRKLWCRDFTATCRDPDPLGDVLKAT